MTTLDKDIIADSTPAAGHIYGAAAMYTFLAFVSIATLYRGKSFGNSCDSADSKPLLQRLDSDDSLHDSPFSSSKEDSDGMRSSAEYDDEAIL